MTESLQKSSFDLVVLGPTLTRNDRHHLPYVVKKASSQTSVLVMHADGSRHPSSMPAPTPAPAGQSGSYRIHENRRPDAGSGGSSRWPLVGKLLFSSLHLFPTSVVPSRRSSRAKNQDRKTGGTHPGFGATIPVARRQRAERSGVFRPAREHPSDSGGGAKATTHGNLVGNSGIHLLRKVRLRT